MLDGRVGALQREDGQWRSTLGWTGEPDGFTGNLANCASGELRLGTVEAPVSFTRLPLQSVESSFESNGVILTGRLLLPPGDQPVPLAVFAHGSGVYSALEYEAYPWALAAQDVATFVYDKRGTGASQGEYSQDFHLLAADARAALAEARRLAGSRVSSAGFLGISQGGWVAPLAASQAGVDFVVSLYGLLVTPLEEDRLEVMQSLARAGWGESEQAKGAALSDAAGEIIASNFRHGFTEFNRLRREYRKEPWYQDLDGEFTPQFLPWPGILMRIFGPRRSRGTSWNYEPMPVVRTIDVPQLWMIAADDSEAPPEVTVARILDLQAEGRPVDPVVYPDAGHGMILTERTETAVRRTGHVPDDHRQIAHWIRSRELGYARAADARVHEAVHTP